MHEQLQLLRHDHHADAHAVRLKMTLVLHGGGDIGGGAMVLPWDVAAELASYVAKRDRVSARCRLGLRDENALLQRADVRAAIRLALTAGAGGQPLTRPSLPAPRRPSLPPPRGASRGAAIHHAETFSAGPQRVQCALNPAAFAAPSTVVSRSPPSPFLGAEQVGSNLEQICQRAAFESEPAAASTPVATADLLGGLDLGGPAPEQAFFEQPTTHALTGQLDLLAPAAPAAGSGSFWDTFAPEQRPPAAAPTLDAALPAQGGAGWAGWAAVQPTPGAADAVRREIRAAAAREDYAEAARLQAELRRLEVGDVGGGATAPLAQEQGGFERGVEVFDESEML